MAIGVESFHNKKLEAAMEGKSGSSTTTYRLKLCCKHPEWAIQTKLLYNQVLTFYHGLLMEDLTLLALGNMELLRHLEQRTIVGRDKAPVERKLPFEKVPVYFRRAAINAAIGSARAYASLTSNWKQQKADAQEKGIVWKKREPAIPQTFSASPVFYKGMYKAFEGKSVMLKLWNGSSWVWVKHAYYGRTIGENTQILSPTLVIGRRSVSLHVPVVHEVGDARSVRERVKDGERFCAVSFTASDVLAVCALFGSDGHAMDSHFVRGGKEYAYRRKRLLNTINKNRTITACLEKGENRLFWTKLQNLNTYYAHLVSKRIIEYCLQNQVKLLVVPKFAESSLKKSYGNGDAGFLGKRIISYLGYKAWQNGIVLTTVRPHYTVIKCSQCREYIRRYNEGHMAATNYYGGRLFTCPNGHKGNTALNTAKNIGNMFYQKFEFVRQENVG